MESWKIRLLRSLPFSYLWILNRSVGGEFKTVLDLGCGKGDIMKKIYVEGWQVTGVDIFKIYLKEARSTGCYRKLIKGDVNKVCKTLIEKRKKFDLILCFELIEHLDRKKGYDLLDSVEKLFKKRVIFTTPSGFMYQPKEFLDSNPYQSHKSGWNQEDFTQRGYSVYGIGFKPVWIENGWGRSRNKFVSSISKLLSFIFSPLVYYLPFLGAGILAVKDYGK